MSLLTVETFYVLSGLILLLVAVGVAKDRSHPRRWAAALFWGVLAVTFVFGKALPPTAVGYMVLVLVGLAALGGVQRSPRAEAAKEQRLTHAQRLGNRLFWPALLIPATAVVGSLGLARVHWGDWWLIEGKQAALISLGLGALLAQGLGLRLTGARLAVPIVEGRRLLEAIGWVLLLPQMLAALGGIFAKAGVGAAVAELVGRALPTHLPAVAVLAYCLGMTLFTICLGNAFAAFPVITLGIGLPLVLEQHGGNPAIMAALGMLSGYCGTLMTPMAANFNLVPAILLDLPDRHAVIKTQVPLAIAIWIANTSLMSVLVYRF